MRTHLPTGFPVEVVVSHGPIDRRCAVCGHEVKSGVRAGVPLLPVGRFGFGHFHLFCRGCAVEIGRVASALVQRKRAA